MLVRRTGSVRGPPRTTGRVHADSGIRTALSSGVKPRIATQGDGRYIDEEHAYRGPLVLRISNPRPYRPARYGGSQGISMNRSSEAPCRLT